jgi:hypothetical protein
MSDKFPTKLIVGLVVAAAIGAGAYFWLGGDGAGLMSLQTENGDEEDAALDINTDQVLQQLNRLGGLTIQSEVFESDVYFSLQDFGISITDQPIGRENPFTPPGNIPGGIIISNPVPVIENPVVEEEINTRQSIQRSDDQPDEVDVDSQNESTDADDDQDFDTDEATTTETESQDSASTTDAETGGEEGR